MKYEHGLALRRNYSHLLSPSFSPEKVYARATNYTRTITSLYNQLSAIYNSSGPFPIETRSPDPVLLPHSACPRIGHVMESDQYSTPRHQEILNQIEDLKAEIEPLAGGLSLEQVFQMSDTLVNYRERDIRSPGSPMLVSFAQTVYTHVLYDLWYGSDLQTKLGATPLLLDVLTRFKALERGEAVPPVALYCAHDLSLVPVLKVLEIWNRPEIGAFLQFELYKETEVSYVQIRYNGELRSIPFCPSPCTLLGFSQSLQPYLYSDLSLWHQICSVNEGYPVVYLVLALLPVLCYQLWKRMLPALKPKTA